MTLALLSRFWPYLAGAALLIGLAAWIDHRGFQRGFHRRDAEVGELRDAIAKQNAAVDALGKEKVVADKAREAAQEAQRERDRGTQAVLDRLAKFKRPVASQGACPNAEGDALAAEMWGRL